MSAPMENIATLNCSEFSAIIDNFVQSKRSKGTNTNVTDILTPLQQLTCSLKSEQYRKSITREVIQSLGSLLELYSSSHCDDEELVDVYAECFRSLRNTCAGCQENQLAVHQLSLIATTCIILKSEFSKLEKLPCWKEGFDFEKISEQSKKVVQCLRCAVQFLGNASTGCAENSTVVWQQARDIFRPLVSCPDDKLATYSCMLIHSCMLQGDHQKELGSTGWGTSLVSAVLDLYNRCQCEWSLLIMEKLLKNGDGLANVYRQLEDHERSMLLDTCCIMLKDLQDDPENQSDLVSGDNIHFVNEEFKNRAFSLLGLKTNQLDNLEPFVLVRLLEVLCAASSTLTAYPQLREDKDLLKCAINLLHTMQMVGEGGENVFSAVTKLSKIADADPDHPVYGLKSNLIRLMANLVCKHRHNQDMVRELGGISLILNNTNIDAKNPFITQWAIFAIHNLLEDNLENQAVVSKMRLEGLADNVENLREFGVEAELKDDKIVVKNTHVDKSPFCKKS